MGACNSKKGPNADGFFHGSPQGFTYDEKFPQFDKKNGLLFRLVDTQGRQWAYYNDSTKYEFHVTVTFGPGSEDLRPLGTTTMEALPNQSGWVAKTIVYPKQTEPFIHGTVHGFDAVVQAVLLTTEYKERRADEKKVAKAAAKNGGVAPPRNELDSVEAPQDDPRREL